MTDAQPKKSDLGVRVASALVMVLVAGTALWLGGDWWAWFVALLGLGVLWEWTSLAFAVSKRVILRLAWVLAGLVYLSVAAWVLIYSRMPYDGVFNVGILLVTVIGVDVGAYIVGRSIGGPKIAPSISPSKTWAGLFGGAFGGGLLLATAVWAWPAGLCEAYTGLFDKPLPPGVFSFDHRCHLVVPPISWLLIYVTFGVPIAIVAQGGDFFESWMKRRAGVKDSGKLIPGHGGLFDRVDGLLAVCFVVGLLWLPSVLLQR